MSEYFKIGKFAASYGLGGELVLAHSLGARTALKDLQALFIEEAKDTYMP
jgi:16S rRNA processing protein RimM